jgi:hypothetical protein
MRRRSTRVCITWQFTEGRLPWQVLLSIALLNLGFDLLRFVREIADMIFVVVIIFVR